MASAICVIFVWACPFVYLFCLHLPQGFCLRNSLFSFWTHPPTSLRLFCSTHRMIMIRLLLDTSDLRKHITKLKPWSEYFRNFGEICDFSPKFFAALFLYEFLSFGDNVFTRIKVMKSISNFESFLPPKKVFNPPFPMVLLSVGQKTSKNQSKNVIFNMNSHSLLPSALSVFYPFSTSFLTFTHI